MSTDENPTPEGPTPDQGAGPSRGTGPDQDTGLDQDTGPGEAPDPAGARDGDGALDGEEGDGAEELDGADELGGAADVEGEQVPEREHQRFSCATEAQLDEALTAARAALDAGEVIVLPTDTVYGIGADAFNSEAVEKLLTAKGRGRDMPPPVLIADAGLIRALAVEVPDSLHLLVEAYWPGPLTVICKAQPSLQMDLGDTAGTVALRVPDHDVARALLRQTGPVAVSSANRTGADAALSVDEAVEQLGNSVAVYLDAGSTPGNVPSTIVDFTGREHGVVVRDGALPLGRLQDIVPELLHVDDLDVDEPEGTVDAEDIAAQIDAATGVDPNAEADQSAEPADQSAEPTDQSAEPTDPSSEDSESGGTDR